MRRARGLTQKTQLRKQKITQSALYRTTFLDCRSGVLRRQSYIYAGPLPGVLAEYVLLSEQAALTYPDYLTPAEASTLPVAAVTAWVALFTHGNLKPGETVLLQGSGGVSLFALQLAVAHGARVLITSRSPAKIARLKQLGATEVIDTSANAAWHEVVLRLTDGRGADHILDVIGRDAVPLSIQPAAWGGHVALIGIMDHPTTTISIPAVMVKHLRLHGVSPCSRSDMEELLAFVECHPLSPIIDARYSFDCPMPLITSIAVHLASWS